MSQGPIGGQEEKEAAQAAHFIGVDMVNAMPACMRMRRQAG
jgi:hypothetical protein